MAYAADIAELNLYLLEAKNLKDKRSYWFNGGNVLQSSEGGPTGMKPQT